ncbi:hypothetical protein FB45DRAFT_1069225 [Roridomyces roridus]|uniref:Uncharacterized protein n=1 Tax=Roridomyces roridus TaxID=1738132 RepID=A0AAD7AZZ6_9AGAR|nr:hypothetical protein FB45DRAFT_1069225 [Roridomyces roridus]
MASYLHIPATLAVAGINFTGAFSRLTSGAHTPEWYAYQIARAPNDAGTMSACIPFVDITLGVLLLPPQTRVVAAAMTSVLFSIGVGKLDRNRQAGFEPIGKRMVEGKTWGVDALLLGLGVFVLGTSWGRSSERPGGKGEGKRA